MRNDATAAILAGGLSRRMGTNKCFLSLTGKPLIQHVIERVSALHLSVFLITNTPARYGLFELPMYGDVYPQCGSLGGLYTALYYSSTDYTLCVACDMPFFNMELLRYMLDLCSGIAAVVPHIGRDYESLQSILVTSKIMGREKTATYVSLVAVFSALAGYLFGMFLTLV